MSKFQQRHYEAIAEVIQLTKQRIEKGTIADDAHSAAHAFVLELTDMFSRDNELFNAYRFDKACQPGANVKARTR